MSIRFTRVAPLFAAVTMLGGASLLFAQQPVASTTATTAPTLDLSVPAVAAPATFSSSSDDNAVAVAERPLALTAMEEAQPPRRRYGRTRYRGGNTNPDGSSKYAFMAGVGFTQPVGNTYHYYKPSYSFQGGVGRNFNRNVGVMFQFDWDNFGLNNRTLAQQGIVYDPTNQYGVQGELGAYSHVWSFSIDPVYNIAVHEGLGAYLTAGAGFYHKITTFTLPEEGEYCDPYYGCYAYVANAPFDTYTSNAPGFNGGLGLTYKVSRFSNLQLYGEIRYVVTLNSQRTGVTYNNYNTSFGATYAGNNYFPENSNRTTYIPVKFGVRF